jgi:DNA-binding transcriptional LysR family regulator
MCLLVAGIDNEDRFGAIERSNGSHKRTFEMRSLNLDQLRTLIAVSRLGSFSAAGRELNLTQPAISLQIRELEERIGLKLLDREGKQTRPTTAGRDLIERAERIMAEADGALAAMRGHKEGHAGRVHLGTGPTALAHILPPVLQQLREKHPDIELVVTTGATAEITERMLASVIDLGLTALPVNEVEFDVVRVRSDPMVAIFAINDPHIPAVVTPTAIAAWPLILEYHRGKQLRLGRAWLSAGGIAAKPALQFDGIEAIKDAVAAGLGAAIVPAPALDDGRSKDRIAARPLDPPLVRTLGLIQRRDKPDDPALRAVRSVLLTLVDGSVDGEDGRREGGRGAVPDAPNRKVAQTRRQPKSRTSKSGH